MARTTLRLLTVTLLSSAALVTGWGSDARACSCAARWEFDRVLEADLVVGGEVTARTESASEIVWDVRVDDRYRGASPDVVQLVRSLTGADECGVNDPSGRVVLALGPSIGGRWDVGDDCSDPAIPEYAAERAFGPVPAVDGAGPPAAIVSAASRDHSLAVVDAEGRPLRYVPSTGWTVGLAPCPGGTRFIQIRQLDLSAPWTKGPHDVVVWSLPELEALEVIPIPDDQYPPEAPSCTAADGRSAIIAFESVVLIDDGVVTASGAQPPEETFDVEPPPGTTSRVAFFGSATEARLAISGGAWVQSIAGDVWRVPYIWSEGTRFEDWSLRSTLSVLAGPDGGWRIVTTGGDTGIVEMTIGDHGWKEGPWRSLPWSAIRGGTAAMFIPPSAAAEIDLAASDVEPRPILDATGTRAIVSPTATAVATMPERTTVPPDTTVSSSVVTSESDRGVLEPRESTPVGSIAEGGDGGSPWLVVIVLAAIAVIALVIVGAIGRRRHGVDPDRTHDP